MKKLIFTAVLIAIVSTLKSQQIDSIVDIRDGREYNIVNIGNQWWMQENLNYGTEIHVTKQQTNNGIVEKYFQLDQKDTIYGAFYKWGELMNYNNPDTKTIGTTQGICPVGWHIPTEQEFLTLIDLMGGEDIAGGKLKMASGNYWESPNVGATNES
ncbi:MAG: hypothetical protein MI922_18295, partial [Bacteroidales bacterium]|nr:hypothetical protein [Bacteroidales bacterium]